MSIRWGKRNVAVAALVVVALIFGIFLLLANRNNQTTNSDLDSDKQALATAKTAVAKDGPNANPENVYLLASTLIQERKHADAEALLKSLDNTKLTASQVKKKYQYLLEVYMLWPKKEEYKKTVEDMKAVAKTLNDEDLNQAVLTYTDSYVEKLFPNGEPVQERIP